MWESTMKYFSPSFSYMGDLSRRFGEFRKCDSGNEDGATAHLSRVEVVQGVHGPVERVLLGVQGDLAGLRQDHELGQVAVGADDVADDVLLAGDELQGRDAQLAAVADDEQRAVGPGHLPGIHLRALLGDEV